MFLFPLNLFSRLAHEPHAVPPAAKRDPDETNPCVLIISENQKKKLFFRAALKLKYDLKMLNLLELIIHIEEFFVQAL